MRRLVSDGVVLTYSTPAKVRRTTEPFGLVFFPDVPPTPVPRAQILMIATLKSGRTFRYGYQPVAVIDSIESTNKIASLNKVTDPTPIEPNGGILFNNFVRATIVSKEEII